MAFFSGFRKVLRIPVRYGLKGSKLHHVAT
jgi:hypothetical protein